MTKTTVNVFYQTPVDSRQIETVAVVLFPQNSRDETILYAARFAARYGASLHCIYAKPQPNVSVNYYAPVPAHYPDLLEQDIQEMADATCLAVEGVCERFGVDLHWTCESTDVVALARHHLKLADIGIVGQPSGEGRRHQASTINSLIIESIRPIVIVPEGGWNGPIGEKVMIAWDDSQQAARAVNDSLPVLYQATNVVDVVSVPSDSTDNITNAKVDEICSFLMSHGVDVNPFVPKASSVGTGSAILNLAAVDKADLLVMGAWGHSRAREYLFGGVTRSMLAGATLPLLVSH